MTTSLDRLSICCRRAFVRRVVATALCVGFCVALTYPTAAQSPSLAQVDDSEALAQFKKKYAVTMIRIGNSGVPTYVRGVFGEERAGTAPSEIVYEFLERNRDVFRIHDPRSEFKMVNDVTIDREDHPWFREMRFDQHVGSVPVSRGFLQARFTKDGMLGEVSCSYCPDLSIDTNISVSIEDAKRAAESADGRDCHLIFRPGELQIVPWIGDDCRISWVLRDQFGDKYLVDAHTGEVAYEPSSRGPAWNTRQRMIRKPGSKDNAARFLPDTATSGYGRLLARFMEEYCVALMTIRQYGTPGEMDAVYLGDSVTPDRVQRFVSQNRAMFFGTDENSEVRPRWSSWNKSPVPDGYQQSHRGIPVERATLRFSKFYGGPLYRIVSRLVPNLDIESEPAVDLDSAKQLVGALAGPEDTPKFTIGRLLIARVKDLDFRLIWSIWVLNLPSSSGLNGQHRLDAETGEFFQTGS